MISDSRYLNQSEENDPLSRDIRDSYQMKSEPSQYYSPTSASKGEEVGKRPIFAAPFDLTTRLRSSHTQHTVTDSCCAFSCYLLTNTADRPTDNIFLYRIGGHLCSRICQNPRYLSKLERRAR